MLESTPQTPLIDFKGGKLNLIHINLDNSESSTKESNISGENSKCLDDTLDIKNDKKKQRKSSGPKSISRNYPELQKILILLHTSEQSID